MVQGWFIHVKFKSEHTQFLTFLGSCPNWQKNLHLCTNVLRTVVSDPCKAMNFERTLTTDISSDFMQSKVGWGVPFTMYLVCHRQSTKGFIRQWSFQQIKKVILHASWRSRYIYTMACNSNVAAAFGSWLSLKNSLHQTIRAHV